jgi:hypothetical protein
LRPEENRDGEEEKISLWGRNTRGIRRITRENGRETWEREGEKIDRRRITGGGKYSRINSGKRKN